jgi:hypothetical protein
MVFASRLVVALAVVGIFSAPLYADVIPSRRPSTSDAPQKVQSRLMELGMSKDAALSQSQELTDTETAYFAHHPDRIQIVGQEPFGGQTDLLWWEWVGGLLAIAGVVFWAVNFR